jgi:hypothetical protein
VASLNKGISGDFDDGTNTNSSWGNDPTMTGISIAVRKWPPPDEDSASPMKRTITINADNVKVEENTLYISHINTLTPTGRIYFEKTIAPTTNNRNLGHSDNDKVDGDTKYVGRWRNAYL